MTYKATQREFSGEHMDPRWLQGSARKQPPDNFPSRWYYEDRHMHVPVGYDLRIMVFSNDASWAGVGTEASWT